MIASEWFSFAFATSLLSWACAVVMLMSVIYWIVTALLFRRWQRQTHPQPSPELPAATFFRPIKPGLPALEEKAVALLASARPGDVVLFGVTTLADELVCLAACREATPAGVTSRTIVCPPLPATTPVNPKVWKLMAMTAACSDDELPEHWIVSDSEALSSREFFDAFRTEWAAQEHGAMTACYRFSSPATAPELLDRLPLLLTLWPGLTVAATQSSGLGFALGACMAVQRDDLEQTGGWDSLLSQLAEDHQLGAALKATGCATTLSRAVITLEGDHLGWREWLRHQHRVAFTYRVCNRWGALGMAVTHGTTAALLLLCLQASSALAWLAVLFTLTARVAHARWMSYLLGFLKEVPLPRFASAVITSGAAESFFWLIAWLPLPVRWNDRALRVDRYGRFLPYVKDLAETTRSTKAVASKAIPTTFENRS